MTRKLTIITALLLLVSSVCAADENSAMNAIKKVAVRANGSQPYCENAANQDVNALYQSYQNAAQVQQMSGNSSMFDMVERQANAMLNQLINSGC